MKNILIEEYNYDLPSKKIADFPLEIRHNSKLLIYRDGNCSDSSFSNLDKLLENDSSLVLNNTKVIEARIFFKKPTGGIIEIFCLEPIRPSDFQHNLDSNNQVQWLCLIGGASKWKPRQLLHKMLTIANTEVELTARYISKETDSFIIEFSWNYNFSFAEVLHVAGSIPLPPYIKRTATKSDSERYQTIFGTHEGSVAAPTASLHFTDKVFEALQTKNIQLVNITLHVGAGTFKPVKSESIADHIMHAEHFYISKHSLQLLAKSKQITAAGTTTLRTLESLYWLGMKVKSGNLNSEFVINQWECYDQLHDALSYQESIQLLILHLQKQNLDGIHGKTSLIIVPGYKFKSANALITNFHQPGSTLLLLVAAFIGEDWKKIYNHALENGYRFLSYGDSSLLFRNE